MNLLRINSKKMWYITSMQLFNIQKACSPQIFIFRAVMIKFRKRQEKIRIIYQMHLKFKIKKSVSLLSKKGKVRKF
jgi:hypothetical protein